MGKYVQFVLAYYASTPFRDTKNGGPVHWIHESYVCPNCAKQPGTRRQRNMFRKCCTNNPNPEVNACKTNRPQGDDTMSYGKLNK